MFLIIKQIVKNMIELDKSVTMANYIFILLSTMMTSIAFNHVILEALTTKGKCDPPETPTIPTIPNQEIQDLYQIKLKIQNKVIELDQLIKASNAICRPIKNIATFNIDVNTAINKVNIKEVEYETLLKNYRTKTTANHTLQKIFKFKYLNDETEAPLDEDHACGTSDNSDIYFTKKVKDLIDTLKVPDSETREECQISDNKEEKAGFTNTSFEGFGDDDKYELENSADNGKKGKLKNDTYTKNITNGSIAVYIFSVLIAIAGFIFHTHAYHIMGAIMNIIIAAMGLHLWTIYHDKEGDVGKIDVDYMSSLISASWALCILTFTVFIFVYLNEESAY
jgi:hypothetical protein